MYGSAVFILIIAKYVVDTNESADIQLKLWNVMTFRWVYVIIVISYMNVVGKFMSA